MVKRASHRSLVYDEFMWPNNSQLTMSNNSNTGTIFPQFLFFFSLVYFELFCEAGSFSAAMVFSLSTNVKFISVVFFLSAVAFAFKITAQQKNVITLTVNTHICKALLLVCDPICIRRKQHCSNELQAYFKHPTCILFATFSNSLHTMYMCFQMSARTRCA